MVVQAIASKCLAFALIAATGVIALDESIEHGYTIPIVADWYWDLESQLLDESLGPYDGNWKGFAVPTDEYVEDSNGETIECGGGYVQIRVYGTKISGTFFDSNGFGYQLSATLLDDGSVSDGTATGLENGGTWQGMFEETIVNGDWQDNYGCIGTWTAHPVSDMSQDVDEIHNETTSGNNTNQSDGNQDNQTNETNETGGQPNGNETTLTNNSETDDEDTSFLENPVVKPLAKAVMGEPYESEPDPEGETEETVAQVGIVTAIGATGQAVKPRKPRKGKQIETTSPPKPTVEPKPEPRATVETKPETKTDAKTNVPSVVKDAGKAILGQFSVGTVGGDVIVDMHDTLDMGVEIAEEKKQKWSKEGDPEPVNEDQAHQQDMDDYNTFRGREKTLNKLGKKAASALPSAIGGTVGGIIGGTAGLFLGGIGAAPCAALGTMIGGSIANFFF